jgi:CheY-like chemotaxis protein
VNLNEIVKAMEHSLDRLIGDKIKLSLFLTDKDLTISADTHQMEQVLINLVTNAMDAMQDGGNLIIKTEHFKLDDKFIKIHGYGKPGPYALLSIEDSGQGMDEETKARIFDPFFSTKGVREGAGLGLSMVYGTIRQHDGYINVYSELGKGTTFDIYLPLSKSKAEAVKEAASHEINGGTETVLVAENDDEARETIKEVLKGSGYRVVEAEDGEKAIRLFHENREGIQLLILDVIMPKKNGKEVFDEIRKVRPDMKAIFTSGYDINVIYKKGFLEEGLDFVSTPILADKLLRKVRAVLGS